MKYECVCVSVWTLLSPHYINICMRIRTMCVCVCATTFIVSLALHCNFVCNAALLWEGMGGGRYLGYVVDGNE